MLGPSEPAQILQASIPPNGWPRGDGGQPVNDLARELVQAGVEVTLVSLTSSLDRVWTHSEGHLNIVQIPMRLNPQRRLADLYTIERRRMRRAITNLDYDVIHAHWTYAYAHVAMSRDRNALISLHDSPRRLLALSPSPGLLALSLQTAWTARRAKNLVASSPYVADTWTSDFRGRSPIAVLPNMTPALPRGPFGCRKRHRVISMGHPHPNKNLKPLIRAWPLVRSQIPDAELFVTGSGTESGGDFDRESRASQLGVKMMGRVPRDEQVEVLSSAALMAHPSLSEACPMSIIEALSQGIPCVAGKQAGPMEWMIDSGGALVDVEDPAALASAVIKLLADDQAYEAARHGALAASRKFDPKVIMPQWLELYLRLAESQSSQLT
jgi:glycosyltransferase involved in cell wall biosynthesis